MRILFLYTYNKSLLSDFFLDIGQKLCEDDHEVKVFSLKKYPGRSRLGKIEITVEKKGGYLNNYFKIFKFIKAVSPDVVISNFSYDNPALLAGHVLKIKRNIVWVHSLKNHGDPGRHQIFLKSQFYKFADSVIVNSFILENELIKVFKVKKTKITAIPFWSNIEEIRPTSININKGAGKILIGCPGRFTIIKNQTVIIDAILTLQPKVKEKIEVYFAGDGPTHQIIEEKVNKLNLQDQINFLGVLSAGQIKDFYMKMDVIVLPSLYESFGLVFIEAISLGTPVIVSSEFGALGFVDKESEEIKKILFDPRNSADLAGKLLNMLEDGGLNKAFFKKIYSDHFDKDFIHEKVIKVLKE